MAVLFVPSFFVVVHAIERWRAACEQPLAKGVSAK
jgi:hypothetical protein